MHMLCMEWGCAYRIPKNISSQKIGDYSKLGPIGEILIMQQTRKSCMHALVHSLICRLEILLCEHQTASLIQEKCLFSLHKCTYIHRAIFVSHAFYSYSYSFVCTLFSARQAGFICPTLPQWWHLASLNLHFEGWWPGFPQHVHDSICCLLHVLQDLVPVSLSTAPEDTAEASPPPWRVITFRAADSIPSAISLQFPRLGQVSKVDGVECVSHLFHTPTDRVT